MSIIRRIAVWNISYIFILWILCTPSDSIDPFINKPINHNEALYSDPTPHTPMYTQGIGSVSTLLEKYVYSKVENFQKWSTEALLTPPIWIRDITSVFPEYLQPIKIELPSNTLEPCLHTPKMDQILKDAMELYPLLHSLKQRTFFRIFKMALTPKSCAKSNDLSSLVSDHKCTAPERCGVCECSSEQIPKAFIDTPNEVFVDRRHAASFYHWRDAGVHKPDDPYSSKQSLVEEKAMEGMKSPKVPGVYVDMMLNPPGFTTYQGKEIWAILYDQLAQLQATEDHHNQCSCGKNIGRIVSGMQSNISALAAEYYHVSNAPKPLNMENHNNISAMVAERVTMPNLEFYVERFSTYPERVQNLYFTFTVLLKSMCKLSNVLQECSCDTGNSKEDLAARAELMHILNTTTVSLNTCSSEHLVPLFDREKLAFLSDMKHVDELLQCVPCEKCQLHGKIKLTSLSIAAKMDSDGPPLKYLERNEVTAFLNALYYFADAVIIVSRMESRAAMHNLLLYVIYVVVIALLCLCFIKLLRKATMYKAFNSSKKCD